MKVYIWGTGELAKICKEDMLPEIEIAGFVESHPKTSDFLGEPVISGKELESKDYDYVILANSHGEEIKEQYSLKENKIIYYMLEIEELDGKILFRRKGKNYIKINCLRVPSCCELQMMLEL